jgi:hypothetical protein
VQRASRVDELSVNVVPQQRKRKAQQVKHLKQAPLHLHLHLLVVAHRRGPFPPLSVRPKEAIYHPILGPVQRGQHVQQAHHLAAHQVVCKGAPEQVPFHCNRVVGPSTGSAARVVKASFVAVS